VLRSMWYSKSIYAGGHFEGIGVLVSFVCRPFTCFELPLVREFLIVFVFKFVMFTIVPTAASKSPSL
jgi:hypothetical protein